MFLLEQAILFEAKTKHNSHSNGISTPNILHYPQCILVMLLSSTGWQSFKITNALLGDLQACVSVCYCFSIHVQIV